MTNNILNNIPLLIYFEQNKINILHYKQYNGEDKKILFKDFLNKNNAIITSDLIKNILAEFPDDIARLIFIQEIYDKNNKNLDNAINENLINFPETAILLNDFNRQYRQIDLNSLHKYEKELLELTFTPINIARPNFKVIPHILLKLKKNQTDFIKINDCYIHKSEEQKVQEYIFRNMKTFILNKIKENKKTIVRKLQYINNELDFDEENYKSQYELREIKKTQAVISKLSTESSPIQQEIAFNRKVNNLYNCYLDSEGTIIQLARASNMARDIKELLNLLKLNISDPIAQINCVATLLKTNEQFFNTNTQLENKFIFYDKAKNIINTTRENLNLNSALTQSFFNTYNIVMENIDNSMAKISSKIKKDTKISLNEDLLGEQKIKLEHIEFANQESLLNQNNSRSSILNDE